MEKMQEVIIDTSCDSCSAPSISKELFYLYIERKPTSLTYTEFNYEFWGGQHRTDEELIKCFHELKRKGANVNGAFRCLKVIEIPADIAWYLCQRRHGEEIHEVHQKWTEFGKELVYRG